MRVCRRTKSSLLGGIKGGANERRDDPQAIPPLIVTALAAVATGGRLFLHLLAIDDVYLALFGSGYLAAVEVVGGLTISNS